MSETELPELSGKVLAIWLIGRGSECSNVIQNARFELQGDRWFLVGEVVENPSRPLPFAGLNNAIAWDQVAEYVAVPTVDELYGRLGVKQRGHGWFGR
jgi:hypothetical protein